MIAVIKTPLSNTTSVISALDRLGFKNYAPKCPFEVSSDTTHLILPGVGHAGAMVSHLRSSGWDRYLLSSKLPFLGICLGFQILFEDLEEGNVKGLGIMKGSVVKLPLTPLPHMGWSKERGERDYFYFVHSYGVQNSVDATHFLSGENSIVSRATKDNFRGTQFHPERSGVSGEKLLKEYLC